MCMFSIPAMALTLNAKKWNPIMVLQRCDCETFDRWDVL